VTGHELDLEQALRCARLTVSLFQPHTPPRRLLDHLSQLEQLASGCCDDATESEARQQQSDLIGTAEAAQILGCSPQYTRRIHADLDGRQIARNAWLFDREKVTEYAVHRNANRRQQAG